MHVAYYKLVRDQIPDIIAAAGSQPSTRVLDHASYRSALRSKLLEEAREAEAAPGDQLASELADVLEVLRALAKAAGVTMIRSPGLAGEPPAWFGLDDDVPRGECRAVDRQHGQFFDGWGRRADHAELPAVAAAQAARTGWAKIIADWYPEDEPVPADALAAVVEAVHAVGRRVAMHSQQAAGGAAAVAARGGFPGAWHVPRCGAPAADSRTGHRADTDPTSADGDPLMWYASGRTGRARTGICAARPRIRTWSRPPPRLA